MSGIDAVQKRKLDEAYYDAPLPGEDAKKQQLQANAPDVAELHARLPVASYPPELFTPAPAPAAPPPPPPAPPLAVAPNAFRGIKLAAVADGLPPSTRSDSARAVRCEPYKLVPALARQQDGKEAVVYWYAINTKTKHGDFIVGASDVETFRANASRYENAAANAYMFGEPDAATRESMKAVDELYQHGFAAGLRQVVKANEVAWSDPRWVTKTAVDTVVGVGAGGAAAAEERPLTQAAAGAREGADAATRARMYQPTETGTATLRAGSGSTNKYGDVVYSTNGTAKDVALVRAHESVHSMLSPKAMNGLREFRADLAMTAYTKSSLCRYLEEALAESYAQVEVNGLAALPDGIRFPITNGYVSLSRVVAEGAIGTIAYGGVVYGVHLAVEGSDR